VGANARQPLAGVGRRSRHQDDRHGTHLAVEQEDVQDFPSVHAGHQHVEQYKIGTGAFSQAVGLA